FTAERSWLQISKMMRIRWLAAAYEARLSSDEAQVLSVAIAPRRGHREHTLVDASGGSLRLLLQCLPFGRSILSPGNVVCAGRREARRFLLVRVLEEFGIGPNEAVFGGERASRPHDSRIGGWEACDLGQKLIAQCCRLTRVEHRCGVAYGAPSIPRSSAPPPKSVLPR